MMQHFNKDDLIKKTIKVIKKHNLFDIVEIVSYLPCSKSTFYNHQLDKVDIIKEALEESRVSIKTQLKKKWLEKGAPATEIALYKLAGTSEERDVLNNNINSHDKDKDKAINVNIKLLTPEAIKKQKDDYNNR